MVAPLTVDILLTIYVISFIFLNGIAFLISSFYRRKFNQPSPQFGFLLTTFFALLYVASLFVHYSTAEIEGMLKVIFLFCSSIASIASAIALYFTMTKVRK
jgi:hypothetical protein